MSTRGKANRGFYGRALTAKQLLVEGAVVAPTAARPLYVALDDLMDRVEEPLSVAQASRYAGPMPLKQDWGGAGGGEGRGTNSSNIKPDQNRKITWENFNGGLDVVQVLQQVRLSTLVLF